MTDSERAEADAELRALHGRPIARAVEYAGGSHMLADIESAVARGDCQEWLGERSAIITEIKQTPQQKILLFWLAAGEMDELRAMAGPICEWGRSIGCHKAQLIGRRGWERSPIARFDGWKFVSIVMEKEL